MTRSPPLYRSFASFPNRLSLDIARTQPIASFTWRQVSPAHPPTAFPTPTFRSIATCRPPCACRSTMSSAAATEALPSLTTAPTLGELATAPAATTLSRPWPRSAGNANSESRTRTRARTNGIRSRSEQKARARRDGVGFATSWQRRGSVDIRGRSVAAVLLSADGCKR